MCLAKSTRPGHCAEHLWFDSRHDVDWQGKNLQHVHFWGMWSVVSSWFVHFGWKWVLVAMCYYGCWTNRYLYHRLAVIMHNYWTSSARYFPSDCLIWILLINRYKNSYVITCETCYSITPSWCTTNFTIMTSWWIECESRITCNCCHSTHRVLSIISFLPVICICAQWWF